jgi:hypothetical protein
MLAAGTALVASSARAQEHGGVLKTLFELEVASWLYTKNANLAAMQDYLADGAVLIFVDGTRFTKAQFLKALPTFGLKSFAVDSKSATLLTASPDVATLLYRVSYTQDKTYNVQASNTYILRQGKWRSLLYQETPAK